MAAAARAGRGTASSSTAAFARDAEQARLFAQHPDPRWVARPGTSLHRLGTELDLGPPSAYGWLAANARRFHFLPRYAWEPWHYGFVSRTRARGRSASAARRAARGAAAVLRPRAASRRRSAARPSAGACRARCSPRRLRRESGLQPVRRARRPGALGIAQFMPGTARAYGLRDPFDPDAAIDAQGHHMRDLLRTLRLRAARAGRLQRRRRPACSACMCIPPIPETQAYVADILGLLTGAGLSTDPTDGPLVRLVR